MSSLPVTITGSASSLGDISGKVQTIRGGGSAAPAKETADALTDLQKQVKQMPVRLLASLEASVIIPVTVANASPLYVYNVGDSLTANPDFFPNTIAWPVQLEPRLAENMNDFGVNGARTDQMIATQMPQVLAGIAASANSNNLVTFLAGVNDLLQSIALATIEANITSMVASVHSAGGKAVLSTITPTLYATRPGSYDANRLLLNTWILSGASGADAVCDLGNNPALSNPNDTTKYQTDKLHLTTLGYRIAAIEFNAAIQSVTGSMFGYRATTYAGTRVPNTNAIDANAKMAESRSVEEFGMVAASSSAATLNAARWQVAYQTCALEGKSLRFTQPQYYSDEVLLGSNISGGTYLDPVFMWSDCPTTTTNGTAVPATVIICTGTKPAGITWTTAAVTFGVANSGNTGVDVTKQLYGQGMKGIFLDSQVSGIAAFRPTRMWSGKFQQCGVRDNPSISWTSAFLCDQATIIEFDECYASRCATGIAGGSLSSTGPSGKLYIHNCVLANNTVSVGLGFTFDSKVEWNSIQSSTTAIVGNGASNDIRDNICIGNSADYGEITETPGGSGVPAWVTTTWKPDTKTFFGNKFSASVSWSNATGSFLAANVFATGSSFHIDSACRGTLVGDQNQLFPSFTDAAPDTRWVGGAVQGTGAPTGSQGFRGQTYFDITVIMAPVEWLCTASGTPATWALVSGGGTTYNPPAWSAYTPSVSPSAGSWTGSTTEAAQYSVGKLGYARAHLIGTLSSTASSIQISFPLSAKNGVSGFLQPCAVEVGIAGAGINTCLGLINDGANTFFVGLSSGSFPSATTIEIWVEFTGAQLN